MSGCPRAARTRVGQTALHRTSLTARTTTGNTTSWRNGTHSLADGGGGPTSLESEETLAIQPLVLCPHPPKLRPAAAAPGVARQPRDERMRRSLRRRSPKQDSLSFQQGVVSVKEIANMHPFPPLASKRCRRRAAPCWGGVGWGGAGLGPAGLNRKNPATYQVGSV